MVWLPSNQGGGGWSRGNQNYRGFSLVNSLTLNGCLLL